MTLRFIDSFDHYDTAHMDEKWLNKATRHSISAGNGRHGSDALYMAGNASPVGYSRIPVTDVQTTWIVGFALKFTNFTSNSGDDRYPTFPRFRSASGTEMLLQRQTHSSLPMPLQIRRGDYNNTILATGSKIIQLNQWYYVEIKYFANNSTGTVEVKINGVVDMSFGPGDTVLSSDQINDIQFGGSKYTGDHYIDDLYVCDALGGVNDDYLGDIRVDALLPDGAGASTDWTPSAGANYQCVDEVPPNDDTDYVSENTLTDHDTYTFGNSPVSAGTIIGVQQNILARKDDAGARSIKGMIRSGGTDYPQTTHVLGDSYIYFLDIFEQDPNTAAAWIIAGINAAEFGQRLEA